MSNNLDCIETYVATNTENHNLRETEFEEKSCSEALIHLVSGSNILLLNHISIYIKAIYIYCVFIGIPVIYYFLYNSEILVNNFNSNLYFSKEKMRLV